MQGTKGKHKQLNNCIAKFYFRKCLVKVLSFFTLHQAYSKWKYSYVASHDKNTYFKHVTARASAVRYRGVDKSLARPDLKNSCKVAIFRPTRRSLLSRRPGWTDNLLNCFWVACKSWTLVAAACFLPGRAKDLSALPVIKFLQMLLRLRSNEMKDRWFYSETANC